MNNFPFIKRPLLGHRMLLIVVTLGALLVLNSCGLTVRSDDDDTPPEVWMEVFGLGENILLEVGGEPIERTVTDASHMIGFMTTVIDEDGGVDYSGIRTLTDCGDHRMGNRTVSTQPGRVEPIGEGDPAASFILSSDRYKFEWDIFNCNDQARGFGYVYDSITIKVWGIGRNFSGGQLETAAIMLIYHVPPFAIDPSTIILEPEIPLDPPEFSLPAMAMISTLCWFGPGQEFGTVSSLVEGIDVKVIGVGAIPGWWIIDNPRFPGVACWVEEEDLELDPDLDITPLPEFEVPALPEVVPDEGSGDDSGGGNQETPADCTDTEYWSVNTHKCEPFG